MKISGSRDVGNANACFYVSFSSRTRKMTLEQFSTGTNWTKFENLENKEKPGNGIKGGHF